MNNSNSQTTIQNQTERRPPPSEDDLARMMLIPCKNGENCAHFKRGRCRYSHESGGRAVQHDPRSHKQIPPTKPALPTEADILASILQKGGLSKNVMKYVKKTESLKLLKGFISMSQLFDELSSQDSFTGKDVADALARLKEVAEKFPNELDRLIEFLSINIKAFSEEKKFKVSDLKATVEELKTTYEVSSDVSDQLEEYQKQCELHAKTLSLDPLAQARENPDGIPTPNFLDHLANAYGLRDNKCFFEMRCSHEKLGQVSPYRNKSFLGILAVHDATNVAEKLLEEHRLKEIEDRKVADAHSKLLQECLAKNNPLLMHGFRILQAQSEFVKFIQSLSEQDHMTLVSVFGSFMSYLAQFCDKTKTQITSEFLSKTFMSFAQSRKVDQNTTTFKASFFNIVHTEIFHELLRTLHVETSSLHRSHDGSPPTPIMVHEIFKYVLKELVDLYENKVPLHERHDFYNKLVKELLPFAFLLSLSPQHSNMLAGRWKKGEIDRTTGQAVNHYLKMQDHSEKKSILYWLLMNINSKKCSRKSKTETCDTFEKLASQFGSECEITNSDGSTETKHMFSPELLFQALRDVQTKNFYTTNFPIKPQSIGENLLGTLFCVEGETISVSDKCPDALLKALYYAFGSNERDPHTRQFSDVKALMHMSPELILKVVEMCQGFTSENQRELVIAIIESLGFKDDRSLEHPLITLLTLISENKSEDLLRRAYDIMSLSTTMIEIHKKKDGYFMSLVDSLVVVLLTEKFPNVKNFDITQALYQEKSKADNSLFMNFKVIQTFLENNSSLADSIKLRLTEFLSRDKRSNPEELEKMKNIVSSLRNILCIHGLQDGSFHDQIKRVIPFLLDRNSLIGLLKTTPEFEIDSSELSDSRNSAKFMICRIEELFEKEITAFIASQNSQIQRDLKARICEIQKISELADRLKAFAFTKHASAIANLANALFSTLALPHRIDAERFIARFPKTKGLSQSESAKLVCAHVLSMIGVVKPIEPAKPVEPVDAVGAKKKSKSKESKAKADYDVSLTEFTLAMEKFQMLENIVSRAISAIYRVEIPKEEGATFKKAPTIQLSGLKDILLQSTTILELFGKCLPYWKSPLVRELILSILVHKFQCGDECVRNLYREIQSFGVSFEDSEISSYAEMFSILNNPNAVLSQTDSYKVFDNEMFVQMKDSFNTDFWNDTNEVEISSQVVQRSRRVLIRRRQKDDDDESEMSFGGGPAPEPEVVEVEEESVPVVEFDVVQLRRLLASPSKDNAIEYMESLSSRDETEEGILELLKDQSSTSQSVLDAVNDVYN